MVGIALAYGFTLAVFYYVYGHISGAHVNPAVTFALALSNTVKWGQAAFCWIAQFAGAILAGLVAANHCGLAWRHAGRRCDNRPIDEKEPIFCNGCGSDLDLLACEYDPEYSSSWQRWKFCGLGHWHNLCPAILGAGTLTGASLNPARTFGIAILRDRATQMCTYVIYLFGPLISATLAVLVYNFLNDIKDEEDLELEELEYVLEEEPVQKTEEGKKACGPQGKKK
ncbi:MAG: aquaporin [Anaerolineales bacterium]|nr:aquaporin [Anaerolineales bacterium]